MTQSMIHSEYTCGHEAGRVVTHIQAYLSKSTQTQLCDIILFISRLKKGQMQKW